MKSKYTLIAAIVLIIVIVIGIISQTNVNDVVEITETPIMVHETIEFERTVIAQLTENPSIANSINPFYGEILFNEAVRLITETSVAPSTENGCLLVPDYWGLNEFSQNIVDNLQQTSINVEVDAFVSVVWNFDDCNAYLPVSNTIRVRIYRVRDESNIFSMVQDVIGAVLTNLLDETDISSVKTSVSILITISFNTEDEYVWVGTNLEQVESAVIEGLSGNNLIDALGGLHN